MLSILWRRFAAIDTFLVEVYRRQLAHVFDLLRTSREAAFKAAGLEPSPEGYSYVGSVSDKGFNPTTGQIQLIEHNAWHKR